MSSSGQSLSDNSETDEQQVQAQSENQHQPYATACFQSVAATPLIGYMMPSGQLEAGQAMSPVAYHPYVDPFYGGIFAAYAGQHEPYLHESRHLHALRRARGCGGRFLNSKSEANLQSESEGNQPKELASDNEPHSVHIQDLAKAAESEKSDI